MKKTGQILKEAREQQGISLQEVSVHLKINIRILKALEEGDRSQLPAKTFLRGFVQSYAQFLKLNSQNILNVFQMEMGSTLPGKASPEVTEESPMLPESSLNSEGGSIEANKLSQSAGDGLDSPGDEVVSSSSMPPPVIARETSKTQDVQILSMDEKTWSHSMKIATGLVILLIGSGIFGILRTIEKYEREARVVQPPTLEGQQVVVRPSLSAEETDGSQVVSDPASSDQSPSSMESGSIGSQSGEGAQQTPSVGLDPRAEPEGPRSSESIEKSPLSQSEGVGLQVLNTPSAGKVQEVIVEALDRVVIRYSIDGKPQASLVLNPEKVHTFRGDQKLQLGFSDGGSVNLIYNGKDKGVPGNLGKPLTLSFPE